MKTVSDIVTFGLSHSKIEGHGLRIVRAEDVAELAASRIIPREYGATYAQQFIGIWSDRRGDDKQRNRRTRRFLGAGVIKPTRANQKEKEAGLRSRRTIACRCTQRAFYEEKVKTPDLAFATLGPGSFCLWGWHERRRQTARPHRKISSWL